MNRSRTPRGVEELEVEMFWTFSDKTGIIEYARISLVPGGSEKPTAPFCNLNGDFFFFPKGEFSGKIVDFSDQTGNSNYNK